MSYFGRIYRAIKAAGAGLAGPQSYYWSPGDANWTEFDYRVYAKQVYAENPYGYTAINCKTTAAGGIKPLVYRKNSQNELAEITGRDDVLSLVMSPNSRMNWQEYVIATLGAYWIGGSSYTLGVGSTDYPGRSGNGQVAWQPVRLWPLNPLYTRPLQVSRIGEDPVIEYDPQVGEKQTYHPGQVFYFRSWNPLDDLDGLPASSAAAKSLDTNNAAMDANKAMLENGALPGTIFTSEKDAPRFETEKERDNFLRQFELSDKGPKRAGKTKLLWGGIKPYKIGMTPQEMSYIDGMRMTGHHIGLVNGVPAELMGDSEHSTFNNRMEARKAFYLETLLPELDLFYDSFTRYINQFKGWDQYVIKYDVDDIEALGEETDKLWARVSAFAGLTVNEKREMLGFDPLGPEGDIVLVPTGVQPLDMIAPMAQGTVRDEE